MVCRQTGERQYDRFVGILIDKKAGRTTTEYAKRQKSKNGCEG